MCDAAVELVQWQTVCNWLFPPFRSTSSKAVAVLFPEEGANTARKKAKRSATAEHFNEQQDEEAEGAEEEVEEEELDLNRFLPQQSQGNVATTLAADTTRAPAIGAQQQRPQGHIPVPRTEELPANPSLDALWDNSPVDQLFASIGTFEAELCVVVHQTRESCVRACVHACVCGVEEASLFVLAVQPLFSTAGVACMMVADKVHLLGSGAGSRRCAKGIVQCTPRPKPASRPSNESRPKSSPLSKATTSLQSKR